MPTYTTRRSLLFIPSPEDGLRFFQRRRYTDARTLPVNLGVEPDTPHQQTYAGPSLSTPIMNLFSFRAQKSGRIKAFYIWSGGVSNDDTIAIFNVVKNGVPLLTSSDKVRISAGSINASKLLSTPVQFGDRLEVALESVQNGFILSPLTAMIII